MNECISLVTNNTELKGKITKNSKLSTIENLEKQKDFEINLLKEEMNATKAKVEELKTEIMKKEDEIKQLHEKLKESSNNGKFLFNL